MKEKHIHKLRRHKYKTGNIIYFCVLDCSFKVAPALAIGKTTICWICGQPFSMNEYTIRLAKPHCTNCHKPKDGKIFIPIPEDAMSDDTDVIDSLKNRLAAFGSPEPEEGEI